MKGYKLVFKISCDLRINGKYYTHVQLSTIFIYS